MSSLRPAVNLVLNSLRIGEFIVSHEDMWDRGFHDGNYEECRLLRYKNPVHTLQNIYYVSATETCRIMLCTILGCHGGDYEECRLLEFYAVWLL
jgi:hypothetical protein